MMMVWRLLVHTAILKCKIPIWMLRRHGNWSSNVNNSHLLRRVSRIKLRLRRIKRLRSSRSGSLILSTQPIIRDASMRLLMIHLLCKELSHHQSLLAPKRSQVWAKKKVKPKNSPLQPNNRPLMTLRRLLMPPRHLLRQLLMQLLRLLRLLQRLLRIRLKMTKKI